MNIQPNNTLYIKNLVDNLHKDEMKRLLYFLFTQHGRVIDIIVKKGEKMRGQAHIVFQDTSEATTAMRSLQGFSLYGKQMNISYAKSKSNATRELEVAVAEYMKAKGIVNPQLLQNGNSDSQGQEEGSGLKRKSPESGHEESEVDDTEKEKPRKKKPPPPPPKKKKQPVESVSINEVDDIAEESEVPNRILFLQNLSDESTVDVLTLLFKQYAGFKQVRMIPNRKSIAFVEFESEQQAMVAKDGLDGFKIETNNELNISFAKK